MYKLLIFDLDGTAIPNRIDGMPSPKLIKAVQTLQNNNIKVCAATGRPRFNSKPITDKLNLVDPCVISGGTQIVDPISGKILWEKDMDKNQIADILRIAMPFDYKIYISDDPISKPAREHINREAERIVYIMTVNRNDTLYLMEKLKEVPDIIAHEVNSWTAEHYDIHITHKEATKKHALEVLLRLLNVNKEEVVAAGDSNNDLPLFELAAFKIAMGNASVELKKRANLITENAEENGLANAVFKIFALDKITK